ncbi:MAG: aminodeoxychorismate lyase [Chromatiales bacterium]
MVVINGVHEDRVSIHDRGLQYGDGLFETIAVMDGVSQHWDLHLQRMARGCQRLAIPFPGPQVLTHDVKLLGPGPGRVVLKLILTRGIGGRGYRPPEEPQPTRIAYLSPWPDYPPTNAIDGVAVRLCVARLGINPLIAGIKHLNRLEQILARREWPDGDVAEGLMLDIHGHLIEGTMSNVFLAEGGCLHTPSIRHCGVAGIMREIVMRECVAAGIPVTERDIHWKEVWQAEEMFLTNSLIGVWPVRRVSAAERQREFSDPRMTRDLRARLASMLPDWHG